MEKGIHENLPGGPGRAVEWAFFVDESGGFDAGEHVLVGGLLVRFGGDDEADSKLRSAIGAVFGRRLPWPLHANRLNQPAYIALLEAYFAEQIGKPAPTDLDDAKVMDVAIRLRRVCRGTFEEALDSVRNGREIDMQTLRELRDNMPPELRGYLEDVIRRRWARLASAMRNLAGDRSSPRIAGFWASECIPWAAASSPDPCLPIQAERYLELLRLLLARVADTVVRWPGVRHEVVVHVLRPHFPRDAARSARWCLDRSEVDGLATSAGERAGGRVTFEVGDVVDLDAQTPAGLVAADLFCFRSLKILREADHKPLNDAERGVRQVTGAFVRTKPPGASHLAAAGESSARIEAARAGRRDGKARGAGSTRRWASEQAEQWVAVFERERA